MKPQHFWTWFQNNEKSFHKLHHAKPIEFIKKAKEFKNRFEKMNTGIGYEILFQKDLKKQGIITFTALGNKNLYQSIRELVNAAPKLKYWKVNAFIQPLKDFKVDKDYSEGMIGISLDQLFFQPIRFYKTSKKVKLCFYTNQYVFGEDPEELKLYVIKLMSLYLGEVFFFKKVKDLKVLKYKKNKDKIYRATELKNFLKNPTLENLPQKSYKRIPKKIKVVTANQPRDYPSNKE